MRGRKKPIHAFNTLEVGECTELKGRAKAYPHQFAYQYAKREKRVLKISRKGKKVFATRML